MIYVLAVDNAELAPLANVCLTRIANPSTAQVDMGVHMCAPLNPGGVLVVTGCGRRGPAAEVEWVEDRVESGRRGRSGHSGYRGPAMEHATRCIEWGEVDKKLLGHGNQSLRPSAIAHRSQLSEVSCSR